MNLTVFRELILALVALATLSIVVVPTAHAQCPDTPLDSDTSSGFTLDFCGVDYDIAAGTSTWTYSLSWDYTPPPLSHFTFELCSQATVLNASPLPYDRIGNDPTTGLYGIVWDQSAFSLPQNISFTLDGLYALGTAQWAPKAGVGDGVSPDSDWFLGLITGPEVNGSIVECISDANCSDDSSCGIETCDPATLTCNSEPLNCDDGVSCTDDACDPVTDSCTNTPYDSYCDDGQWCNGPESCDPVNGCQAGAPVVCDDGVACTMDACDEAADSCSSRQQADGFGLRRRSMVQWPREL